MNLTLEDAHKELEILYNDLNFQRDRLASLELLVSPKAQTYTGDRVDGGMRIDKMLEFAELEEKYNLYARIKYDEGKIKDLENWVDRELQILKDYNEIEYLVVYYKECYFLGTGTGHRRRLSWYEISKKTNYSIDHIKHIYSDYKKRNFNKNVPKSVPNFNNKQKNR